MSCTAMSPGSNHSSYSPFSDIVVLEIANADAGAGVIENDNDVTSQSPSTPAPLPVRLFKVKRRHCHCESVTPPQAPSKKVFELSKPPKKARFALQPVRFDIETGTWDVSSEDRVRISPSKHYVTSAYDGKSSSLEELLNSSRNEGGYIRNHRSENPLGDSTASSSSTHMPNDLSGQNDDAM